MPRFLRLIPMALTASVLLAASPIDSGWANSPAYLQMLRGNRDVRSSVADIEVQTHLTSFPPVTLTFHGHSYFRAPDKQNVVFDDLPRMLSGMVKDSPSLLPAAAWPNRYDVAVVDSSVTHVAAFHVTPRDANDPLESADVTVDDRTGLVSRFVFNNKNGSTVTTDQTYSQVGKYEFLTAQTGSARGPGYRAEVTTTFSNYRVNVRVPDSVFEKH